MEHFYAPLEIKAVDRQARTIDGYAAIFDTEDKVSDVIDPAAFDRTLREHKVGDFPVFIAHNAAALPVGIPLSIAPDSKGLLTKTQVFSSHAGDDLLAVADNLASHGRPLGMSIGYQTVRCAYEPGKQGKTVRRLQDVELREYSYAASQITAHPDAQVTRVKSIMGEGGMLELKHYDVLKTLHDAMADPTHDRATLLNSLHDNLCPLGRDCPALSGGKAAPVTTESKDVDWLNAHLTLTQKAILELGDQVKAGKRMASAHQDQMHTAIKGLLELHDSQCSAGEKCPVGQKAGKPSAGDAGDDDGDGDKTLPRLSDGQRLRYRLQLASSY